MLDDLRYIHEHDAADALGIAEKQYQQLGHEFEVFQDQVEADNIVYAGMGGSALAALLSQSWPGYSKPFEVVRGYDVPAYVGPKTYFIAASYSGNTEEVLSAIEQAEAKGAQIAVIAGGGKLADLAREKNYPLALLPKAAQPRYAVLYNLKALLVLLDQAGLLAADTIAELEGAADFLQQAVQPWLPTVPGKDNRAKQIALDVIGKSVVVYGGQKLWPAAYKWKISFNENAKQVAWWGQYPEFNHNEFLGWSEQPVDKPYAVIDLRSNLEHPRVQKRFEVSERLLSGKRPAPIVVQAEGKTPLEQLLWTVAFGDFVSLYTALANGLNPAPVDLIEKFKKSLDD
ncbi:MAG: bifunctional phosphoglucose/phosphomannose isomerase [Candidatus Saccharibacteria bacterium]|nr:bifunctional phosphoglucose/phosphomannose isomerase [Candidatus Saccharibacteria bacterium]